MTGPRRRPVNTATAFRIGPLDDEPAELRHPTTWRTPAPTPPVPINRAKKRAGARPADELAKSRQHRREPDRTAFARIPDEVLFDATLELLDVVVFAWMTRQPELWSGTRGAVSLTDCARDVRRTERNVRYSIKRLAAAGHVIVYPHTGAKSEYSLPWIAIHSMARKMTEPR